MMGQQARSESLFYYFRLEEQIPQDHLVGYLYGITSERRVLEEVRMLRCDRLPLVALDTSNDFLGGR
jgi:hypothetical protein